MKDSAQQAFIPTGQPSHKVFQLPNGTRTQASNIHHLHHNVQQPAKDIQIILTIATNLLLSTAKFATAGYITVFDGKEVNIYNASNTEVIVTREAILRGWFDKTANLWRIPLLPLVQNTNTNTFLVKKPPTEFLPDRPPPSKAVHNVYKLKTQPKLIRYLHTAAGFPTKPTWIAAIKNKQFASWPGLTAKAVTKHYPESKETMKGHDEREEAASGQPNRRTLSKCHHHQQPKTPTPTTAMSELPKDVMFSSKSFAWRRKGMSTSSWIRPVVTPKNPVEEINTSWYCPTPTATQSSKKR
jgi:hypothetical protein